MLTWRGVLTWQGTRWRTAREDECLFDEEAAKRHPYELTQTRRRCALRHRRTPTLHAAPRSPPPPPPTARLVRYEIEVTIPVPPKTRACDVRIKIQKEHLRVTVVGSVHGLPTRAPRAVCVARVPRGAPSNLP